MKKCIVAIIIMICAMTTNKSFSFTQQTKGFELKGKISGMKDGTTIYLRSHTGDTLARVKSEGTNFILRGYVKGEANYYFIRIDTGANRTTQTTITSNALWLINNKMRLAGDISNLKQLLLKGSEPNDEYYEMKAMSDNLKDENEKTEVYKRFIKDHTNSLYIGDLIIKILGANEDAYHKLTNRAKNSYWGNALAKLIAQKKEMAKINGSGKIPNFKITTPNGEEVSIHHLASKYKYTLIDFWASWCGPCRSAIPKLRKVYEAFHSKGFNIIGVSVDSNPEKWKKAVIEDKTPWIHGLDNINQVSKNIFGLGGIPGYILIEQNGRIIYSNLVTGETSRFRGKDEQIGRFQGMSLSGDLFGIIETLLKEGKNK